MSAKILEGKFFAQQLKDDAGRRAAALQEKYGRAPGLAVIRVGNDPASLSPCPKKPAKTN